MKGLLFFCIILHIPQAILYQRELRNFWNIFRVPLNNVAATTKDPDLSTSDDSTDFIQDIIGNTKKF